MDIQVKKFVVIPRDAFDLLMNRFVDEKEAEEAASERCADTGMSMYVVEMKSVAARADRPVKVKKL